MSNTTITVNERTLASSEDIVEVFTSRERSVIKLLGLEYSSKEIALSLGIAEETVKKHRKNIIRKSGFSGKRALQRVVRYYLSS
ncbi:response regulator transcription factor [uncultured Fibrella sp.]|uniref:response regulator transcription factor n=1 Tax=uncultured Fibrella sp. TaxID=1284596 RepID=UPI0035CC5C2C